MGFIPQDKKEIVSKLDSLIRAVCKIGGGSTTSASVEIVAYPIVDANGLVHEKRIIRAVDGSLQITFHNPVTGATSVPIEPIQGAATVAPPVTYQHVVKWETVAGSIPVGTIDFNIVSLGDGVNTPPDSPTWSFKGQVVPSNQPSINAPLLGVPGGTFEAMTYDPNGNTLFVQYTIKL